MVIYYWFENPPPLHVRLMRTARRWLQAFFHRLPSFFRKRQLDVSALIG
jgi:hypothetical protein